MMYIVDSHSFVDMYHIMVYGTYHNCWYGTYVWYFLLFLGLQSIAFSPGVSLSGIFVVTTKVSALGFAHELFAQLVRSLLQALKVIMFFVAFDIVLKAFSFFD